MRPAPRPVLALLLASLGCGAELRVPSRAGRACVVPTAPLHDPATPLAIGDSARLTVGRIVEGVGCVAPAPGPVRWRSSDTSVATVAPGEWLVARGAGVFDLHTVVRGGAGVDTLAVEGHFVLPRDYRVRVLPESATAAVGDTVTFEARAVAADGTLLPRVPYQLTSAEWGPRPSRRFGDPPPPPRPAPLVDGTGVRRVTGPHAIVALRPGTTQLVGAIGGVGARREARAALRIVPGH